jgi:hypothetical protein
MEYILSHKIQNKQETNIIKKATKETPTAILQNESKGE